MKQFCFVHIENGEIVNKKTIKALFTTLKDGKYLLEVNSKNKRSDPQNRYYFGVIVPMVQKGIYDLGTEFTKEEVHEFLKARFNTIEIFNEANGGFITIPQSTTRLTKEQFGEYIAKIQQFAAEFLSIVIPDPGQQQILEYA